MTASGCSTLVRLVRGDRLGWTQARDALGQTIADRIEGPGGALVGCGDAGWLLAHLGLREAVVGVVAVLGRVDAAALPVDRPGCESPACGCRSRRSVGEAQRGRALTAVGDRRDTLGA